MTFGRPSLLLAVFLLFVLRRGARAEDANTGELRYLQAPPEARPLALPVEVPEMSGQKAVRVKMDAPPGAYVVSVSASAEE